MRAFEIVKVEIGCYLMISLLGAVVFVQVNFFVFDRAPKPFGEDVIQRPSAAIHADFDVFVLQAL